MPKSKRAKKKEEPEMQYSIIFTAAEYIRDESEKDKILKELEEEVEFVGNKFDVTELECEEVETGFFECHKKITGILDQDQFDYFLDKYGLEYEGETMGSLGSYGFGFGWTPAVSFIGETESRNYNAYVTPFTEKKGETVVLDEYFEKLRKNPFSNF
jgi:hypothetical protein